MSQFFFNYTPPLRAEGNLSYLQFIALVERYWEDSHPDIRVVPTQGQQFATSDPVIVYGLELRKTHPVEPKPRYREEIVQVGEENFIIHGWRFMNIVTFTAVHEDPKVAEEIIEMFEDFMLEFTPVFKRLGVSELMYSRRMPDSEENRQGEDKAKRTLAYSLVTEKVTQTSVTKLQEILIDARIFVSENRVIEDAATPSVDIKITDLYDSDG